MAKSSEEFDKILREVGTYGKFQKKLLICLILPYILVYAFLNGYLFLLGVPDHWCHVPGRENTNYTLQEWKDMLIPKITDENGEESFSKCEQYSINTVTLVVNHTKINCENGWFYSSEVYEETAVSKFNWVCENQNMEPLSYTVIYVASAVSPLIFGPLMDKWGRKPVFLITVVIYIIFGSSSFFTSSSVLFLFLWFLKYLVHPPCAAAVLIISCEYVVPEQRGKMKLLLEFAWPISMSLLSFVMWAFKGHWVFGGLATTLPFLIFLPAYQVLPESPRWLAATGKSEKAEKILTQLAIENKNPVPKNLTNRLKLCSETDSTNINLLNLFQYQKQSFRIALVAVTTVSAIVIYYGVTLNLTNIGGNIYFNFFILAIMELPGYIAGRYLMDTTGRRFSTAGFLVLCGVACIVSAFLPSDVTWIKVLFSSVAKFGTAGLWITSTMHATELFPTSYRSVAMTPSFILSQIFNIIIPWIINLGKVNSKLPFLVMAAFPLLTAPFYLLLPETHNQSLPQTIEEAENFGKGQKIRKLNLKNSIKPEIEVKY